MRVLVSRPAGSAAATAARIEALGHIPIVAPLFAYAAVPWRLPDEEFDALMLTSAAAVRHAGKGIAAVAGLPCHVVGPATRAAALAAGLRVLAGEAVDAASLVAEIAASGHRRVVHLCGRDVARASVAEGVCIERIVVYAAEPRAWSVAERAAAAGAEVVLAYSPRGGHALADALPEAARKAARLAAISAAAAKAAGGGWRAVSIADRPDEDALFAAAGLLCQ